MKLSSREKKLILALAVAGLVMGYYKYILEPQMNKIKELTEKRDEYNIQIQSIDRELASLPLLDKNLRELNAKISFLTLKLYPSIFQEKIIMILDEKLLTTGLEATAIVFTNQRVSEVSQPDQGEGPQESSLRQFVKIYQDATGFLKNNQPPQEGGTNQTVLEEKEEKLTRTVEQMTATIEYAGTYQTLLSFLKEVEKGDKLTPIKSLEISKNTEDDTLQGKIEYEYYAVPSLNMQDEKYYRWSYVKEYGKGNPFDLFSGYVSPSSLIKYDFVMTLNPYSSGLPTVILGKNLGEAGNGFIYAINEADERVDLEIQQIDGRYYYKYRTESDSFPLDYDREWVEFVPHGNRIEFKITSRKRVAPSDKAGIILSVVNQSDLSLQITLEKDDPQRSRVLIERMQGNIQLKKVED